MTERDQNIESAREADAFDWEGQSVDWFLQNLVSIVNNSGIEFGVTLSVEGMVLSGTLVSGKKYFEIFAEQFANAYPGKADTKEEIREALAKNAELYTEREEDESRPPPQFIHLEDCRHFSTSGHVLPGNQGFLWRGRINAVSGFSLGSLSID